MSYMMNLFTSSQIEKSMKCRLCSGSLTELYTLTLMRKITVKYYTCNQCRCLQTEEPYWLSEAYSDPVRYTDTFAAHRCVSMSQVTYLIFKLFGLTNRERLLDWGGGDGLLTRMLRDLGINAYCYDLYGKNLYAGGFNGNLDDSYDMVTAFEVLEHMASPANELQRIFSLQPKVLLFSTCLYYGQGKSWSYLAPYSGRHIFFFSRESLQILAKQFQYEYIENNNLIVFYRLRLSSHKKWKLKFLLSQIGLRLASVILSLKPPTSLMIDDWNEMRCRVKDYDSIKQSNAS